MYNEDIFELAGSLDKPNLTSEWHKTNDFYGGAHILKQYAGLREDYPLKIVVPHGPGDMPGMEWDLDLHASLPAALVFNVKMAQHVYQKTGKLPLVSAPLIAYAGSYLLKEENDNLKKKLGKNLLVFLPHSTHHNSVEMDTKNIIAEIEKEAKNYDSVTISLYWKEVNLETVTYYSSFGYHCVTSGHIYDTQFLNRQRAILELCDGVLCIGMISAFYYAAFLNKKIKLVNTVYATYNYDEIDKRNTELSILGTKPYLKYYTTLKAFFEEMTSPSDEIKCFFRQVCDFEQIKTSEEIKLFLKISEDMYKLGKRFKLKSLAQPFNLLKFYKLTRQKQKEILLTKCLQKIQVL